MGTTGNLAWGENGGADVVEPIEGQKSIGWANNDIPPHETFNWQARELGRASVRRFAGADLLAEVTKDTGPATTGPEDLGCVLQDGIAYNSPPFAERASSTLGDGGGAGEAAIVLADGRNLWTIDTSGGGGNYTVNRRNRDTLALELASAAGLTTYAFLLATAGGSKVYALDDGAAGPNPRLLAVDRDTLVTAYSATAGAGGAGTATAIATDGYWVAVASSTTVYLFQDTGAALTPFGSRAIAGVTAISALEIDGQHLFIGTDPDASGRTVQVCTLDAGVTAVYYHSRDTTGVGVDASMLKLAADGREVAVFSSVNDAAPLPGPYCGMILPWRGAQEPTWRWAGSPFPAAMGGPNIPNGIAFVEDKLALAEVGGVRLLLAKGGRARGPRAQWAAGTAYALGTYIQPTAVGGVGCRPYLYQATAIAGGGTSAGAEPTWPALVGTTVIDNPGANQITWTCIDAPAIGEEVGWIDWNAGAATATYSVAFDGDRLYVTGAATATGRRMKRYDVHNGPRLFGVVPDGTVSYCATALHSKIQPIS